MADSLRATLAEDAFREGNLVAVGETATAPELTEANTLLDRVIGSLIGNEIGESLRGIPQPLPDRFTWNYDGKQFVPKADKPPVNSRLIMNQTDDFTTTWDPRPGDGARMAISAVSGAVDVTVDASGHFIDTGDRTVLQETVMISFLQGEYYEWMYRADLSTWILIDSNAAGAGFPTLDSSPFPPELDDLLITATTIRLQPRWGQSVLVGTSSAYTRMLRIAKARYAQHIDVITNPDVPLNPSATNMDGWRRG